MTDDPRDLIDGYLDGTLDAASVSALAAWIRAEPAHAAEFARAARLHDRLRDEVAARAVLAGRPDRAAAPRWRVGRLSIGMAGAVAALLVVGLVLWRGVGGTTASAATAELDRLARASAAAGDRAYRLTVEEAAAAPAGRGVGRPEASRPPKEPLDDGVLYAGPGRRFVLVRTGGDGRQAVAGSDGRTSWAVRPDGVVRVSPDPTHFARDVPGHEHGMSLTDVGEVLERLRTAYDIEVMPVEAAAGDGAAVVEPTRLLVAVRRSGNRGPRRVEVSYAAGSGRILQIRFVDMPYGPDRLTVRLTLDREGDPGAGFYEHTAHHAPDRRVEQEDKP